MVTIERLDRSRRSPRRATRGRSPAIVAVGSFLAYFLLPLLAPAELDGEVVVLLLGIVNGIAVGVGLRLRSALTVPLAVGAFAGILARFFLDEELELFVVIVALVTRRRGLRDGLRCCGGRAPGGSGRRATCCATG